MTEVQGLMPVDDLESAIRLIAEAFNEGGDWAEKYGVTTENHLFSMHPFCWCDGEDCQWCSHDAPNFQWKPTGGSVWWYKYIGRGMRFSNTFPADMLALALASHPKKPTALDVIGDMQARSAESARLFREWVEGGAAERELFE